MLSARGVLRREKGTRELVPTGTSLEEKLQEIQSIQVPTVDPLLSRTAKYKKLQDALSVLDEKLAKLKFYTNSFEPKRSDPASQAAVAQFNALVKTTQAARTNLQKQKDSLEPFLQKAEHEKGLFAVEDYLRLQEAEKESVKALQMEAKALYKQRGALCDSEGFYQHYVECWSDSIQQLFLNADGLKEVTQKYLILYPDLTVQSLPDLLFTGVLNPFGLSKKQKKQSNLLVSELHEFIQLQKQWVTLYFHEVKKRFLRHYLTEGKRRAFVEECSLREPTALVAKRQLAELSKQARRQGKEGVGTAIFGKLGRFETAEEEIAQYQGLASLTPDLYASTNLKGQGGTLVEILVLLNLFNAIFFSNELGMLRVEQEPGGFVNGNPGEPRVRLRTPEELTLPETKGILASASYFDPSGTSLFRHMIAFYTCGGKQFLFDNENGLFPCDFNTLLSVYFEKAEERPSLTFCSFVKEDSSEKQFTSMYPVLEFPTEPPTYGTVLDGAYVEIPSLPFSRGSLQLSQEQTVVLNDLILISQTSVPSLENTGYEFHSEARLGRLTEEDLTAFIAALSKPVDEAEAVKQLSALTNPPLDFTILTPKTAIPYPLVYLAVRLRWLQFLALLLQKGYDPNSSLTEGPRKGMTALMLAASSGYEEAVKLLLQAKADPNLSDEKGVRAIHTAVLQKNLPIVKLLVEAGADLNVQTYTGATPLYYAASSDATPLVEYLCTKGADPTVKGAGLPNDPKRLPLAAAKTLPTKSLLMKCRILHKGGTRRKRHAKRKTRRRN